MLLLSTVFFYVLIIVFPEFPLLVQCYAEIVKSEKTQSAMNSISVNLIYCIIMIKIFGRWTPGIFDE